MSKLVSALFALAWSGAAFAHGISEADKKAMLAAGYVHYVWLGAKHMLTGYDHLLFIFGVIFFLTTFKDIVKFITAFTLGHSITLIFATLFKITANYFLIDAVIALSVAYKGFDNNDGFKSYLGVKAPDLLKVVFGFGLIHGFGLSTRLQQLPLGEDTTGLLLRIVSFNVGVEIGLGGMLILLSSWRHRPSFTRFSRVANDGLIAAGALLLIMQMHGYLHGAIPDDFGFATDNHAHAHEDMQREEAEAKAKSIVPDNILN